MCRYATLVVLPAVVMSVLLAGCDSGALSRQAERTQAQTNQPQTSPTDSNSTDGAFLIGPGSRPGSCLFKGPDNQSRTFEAPCD